VPTSSAAGPGSTVEALADVHHRFFNAALAEVAAARGLRYEEWAQGWCARVGDGRRWLSAYGYQLSLNSAVSASVARDKGAAAERLALDGLPVVPTQLVLGDVRQRWLDGRDSDDVLDQVLADATFPLVVKPNEGSSGEGVFWCEDPETARRRVHELLVHEQSVVVQPFLELEREERWVLLDGRAQLRYVKQPAPPSQTGRHAPLFNLAAGATVGQSGLGEADGADPSAEALAVAAMGSLGLRTAAVDLVTGVDGRRWVLEVNSGLSFEHLVRLRPDLRADAVAVYDAALSLALATDPSLAGDAPGVVPAGG
jgi:glutathione synthase/RimK-type ligase-like ATP-grasp enzyme